MVSIIGASSTVSRIAIGFATDYMSKRRLTVFVAFIMVNGAAALVFIAGVYCVEFLVGDIFRLSWCFVCVFCGLMSCLHSIRSS